MKVRAPVLLLSLLLVSSAMAPASMAASTVTLTPTDGKSQPEGWFKVTQLFGDSHQQGFTGLAATISVTNTTQVVANTDGWADILKGLGFNIGEFSLLIRGGATNARAGCVGSASMFVANEDIGCIGASGFDHLLIPGGKTAFELESIDPKLESRTKLWAGPTFETMSLDAVALVALFAISVIIPTSYLQCATGPILSIGYSIAWQVGSQMSALIDAILAGRLDIVANILRSIFGNVVDSFTGPRFGTTYWSVAGSCGTDTVLNFALSFSKDLVKKMALGIQLAILAAAEATLLLRTWPKLDKVESVGIAIAATNSGFAGSDPSGSAATGETSPSPSAIPVDLAKIAPRQVFFETDPVAYVQIGTCGGLILEENGPGSREGDDARQDGNLVLTSNDESFVRPLKGLSNFYSADWEDWSEQVSNAPTFCGLQSGATTLTLSDKRSDWTHSWDVIVGSHEWYFGYARTVEEFSVNTARVGDVPPFNKIGVSRLQGCPFAGCAWLGGNPVQTDECFGLDLPGDRESWNLEVNKVPDAFAQRDKKYIDEKLINSDPVYEVRIVTRPVIDFTFAAFPYYKVTGAMTTPIVCITSEGAYRVSARQPNQQTVQYADVIVYRAEPPASPTTP